MQRVSEHANECNKLAGVMKSYLTSRQTKDERVVKLKGDYRSRIRALKDANEKQKGTIHQLQDTVQEIEEKVVEQQQLYLETLDDVSVREKRMGELHVAILVQEERTAEELQLKHVEAATKDEQIAQFQRDVTSFRQKLKEEVGKTAALDVKLKAEKEKLVSLQELWTSKLSKAEERSTALEGNLNEAASKLEEKSVLVHQAEADKQGILHELAKVQEVCGTLKGTQIELQKKLTKVEQEHANCSQTIAKNESDHLKSVERNATLVSDLAQAEHDLEIAKSQLFEERQVRLSHARATVAGLRQVLLPMKRSFESMQTMQQAFKDCQSQTEAKLKSAHSELTVKNAEIGELTKVAHETSMALTKYKNSCTDALRKLDGVVRERDELSKSVAALKTSVDEQARLEEKLETVEEQLKEARDCHAKAEASLESKTKERDELAKMVQDLQKQVKNEVATKDREKLVKTVTTLRQQLKEAKNAKSAAAKRGRNAKDQPVHKPSTPSARTESVKMQGNRGRLKTKVSDVKTIQGGSTKQSEPSDEGIKEAAPVPKRATRSRSVGRPHAEDRKPAKRPKQGQGSPSRKSSSSDNFDLFEDDLFAE